MTKPKRECKFSGRPSSESDLQVQKDPTKVVQTTMVVTTGETTATVGEKMQVLASTSILPLRRAATRARADHAEKVENQKEERVRKETDHALLKLERTHMDPKTWLR